MDRNSSEASIRSSEFLKTGLRTLIGWAGPTTGRRLLSFSNEKLSNSSEFLENWALRFSNLRRHLLLLLLLGPNPPMTRFG
jgi:hypothetical protein